MKTKELDGREEEIKREREKMQRERESKWRVESEAGKTKKILI